MPDEYVAILRAAEDNHVWRSPQDYLIPNRRPASVRSRERSDKVIWDTVKSVAARLGINAHVHALRAAFAVQFDEAHPDQVIALKELMGHTRLETTLVYLRRKNKARAMEVVRDLSFSATLFPPTPASGFEEDAGKAHTGFEPVLPP
jgi:site-specific recombinase XerD